MKIINFFNHSLIELNYIKKLRMFTKGSIILLLNNNLQEKVGIKDVKSC